jgi:putative addiction module component (TIGR02574 family)
MAKATENVLQNALLLPVSDRAELAAALLASLDGEPEEDVEAAWSAEIERRASRVRSGDATGRPWPVIREELERKRG